MAESSVSAWFRRMRRKIDRDVPWAKGLRVLKIPRQRINVALQHYVENPPTPRIKRSSRSVAAGFPRGTWPELHWSGENSSVGKTTQAANHRAVSANQNFTIIFPR